MASGAAPFSVTAWHSLATDTATAQLDTDPALGLSDAEVAARLERHGPNQISEAALRSKLRMLPPTTDFMILLLVAAAIVPASSAKWKTPS
jgi:Ca2+-transporting ATPase